MLEPISFGTWLRQRRRALDLTQKAFADQVGCAEITVRRMEADAYRPSNDLAFVLFEKLGIPEAERSQWVSFARGLAENPNTPVASSPSREQNTNLPIQLTSFIGREKEITEVRHLIATHRLVTLTGSGGTGKTRLALQVASELRSSFSDGVWLVEFASLSDPTLVPFSLANLFGLRESGASKASITELLVEYFRARKALIIFDNCEHLIEATARLANLLLQSSSKLCILATSREALRVKGEMAYRVPSLDIPNIKSDLDALMKSESACLFVERALDSAPSFSVASNNASTIAQICQHLDGIPLALELAAARVKMMTVEEIAKRLDDRFHLLSSGARTALPRHQTLRTMIDWSYNLLAEQEKTLFCRLAVFVGGWTLEAAESVCSDTQGGIASDQIVELLSRLIDKSLVIVENVGNESRYHCLETIRQYAHEKLLESGEGEALRKRHLQFFLEFAVDAASYLHGTEALFWCDRMEADHDNLRLALEWTQMSEDRAESGLQLVNALLEFWLMRGYVVEGRERAPSVLNHGRSFERTALYANILCSLGWLGSFQGDFPGGRAFANESLAIFRELGDKLGIAYALQVLGSIAVDSKDYGLAESLLEEALDNRRETEVSNASLLVTMGWAAFGLGNYALARDRLNQVLTLSLTTGERGRTSQALGGLAEVDLREGRYESASKLIEESLTIERENGDRWHIGVALGVWGWIAVLQRDWEAAFSRLKESVAVRKEISDRGGLVWCLEKLGQVTLGKDNGEKAVIIFSAAASTRTALGSAMDPFDQSEYEHNIAALRDQLGDEKFNEAWNRGHKLTLEKAIDFALEEN